MELQALLHSEGLTKSRPLVGPGSHVAPEEAHAPPRHFGASASQQQGTMASRFWAASSSEGSGSGSDSDSGSSSAEEVQKPPSKFAARAAAASDSESEDEVRRPKRKRLSGVVVGRGARGALRARWP